MKVLKHIVPKDTPTVVKIYISLQEVVESVEFVEKSKHEKLL